jgi:hypothetical protein
MSATGWRWPSFGASKGSYPRPSRGFLGGPSATMRMRRPVTPPRHAAAGCRRPDRASAGRGANVAFRYDKNRDRSRSKFALRTPVRGRRDRPPRFCPTANAARQRHCHAKSGSRQVWSRIGAFAVDRDPNRSRSAILWRSEPIAFRDPIADGDAAFAPHAGERDAGELATLIRVEDVRRAGFRERVLHRHDPEIGRHRDRQPPQQTPAAEPFILVLAIPCSVCLFCDERPVRGPLGRTLKAGSPHP